MGIPRSGAASALMVAAVLAAGGTLCLGAASQASVPTGTIQGRVTMTGAPAPGTLKVTTDEKICGLSVVDERVVIGTDGGIANAVVEVRGLAWSGSSETIHVTNKGCRFVPHVSVARPGATVEITSEDRTLHTTHLYAPDDRSLFNIALPVPGMVIRRPLEKQTGAVRIACDTHPWMRGFIAVTSDRSVVSGGDGRFQVADVPAGSWELVVWHESLRSAPQKIDVAAGRTTEVTFTLTAP